MQQIVNRSVIVVTPRAPFLEWVQNADDRSAHITAEDVAYSPNAYLVTDTEDGMDPEKLIKKNFKAIFEEELTGWIVDESIWPQKRDLRTFKQWFQATVHEIVYDLSDKPLLLEEC